MRDAMMMADDAARLKRVQRYVSFDALFMAVKAQARDMGVSEFDLTACPCCGLGGGGVRRARLHEPRKFHCIGEVETGCGFIGGPLDWVMAGGLGVVFTNPDQARKAVTVLFAAHGWIPDWHGGSAT